MKNKKIIFVISLVFSVLMLMQIIVYINSNTYPVEYCRDGEVYTSDDKLIKIAFESYSESIKNFAIYSNDGAIFYKNNPDCCSVERKNERGNLITKILFNNEALVTIIFPRVNHNEVAGKQADKFYLAFVTMNSCGKVLDTMGELTNLKSIAPENLNN